MRNKSCQVARQRDLRCCTVIVSMCSKTPLLVSPLERSTVSGMSGRCIHCTLLDFARIDSRTTLPPNHTLSRLLILEQEERQADPLARTIPELSAPPGVHDDNAVPVVTLPCARRAHELQVFHPDGTRPMFRMEPLDPWSAHLHQPPALVQAQAVPIVCLADRLVPSGLLALSFEI